MHSHIRSYIAVQIQGIKSHEMNNPLALNDEDLQIPKDMHDCKFFAPPYS